jgi:UDP-N-acetylmuramate dehydrogenase
LEFGYGAGILGLREVVVVSARVRRAAAPVGGRGGVMRENLEWRDEKHPDLWLYPCAGSIFKKIDGIGAGRLIDQCGLKGRIHGGAGIFHKHANIIVNLGGATASDVRALMDLAQTTVRRELGYELLPEIELVGEF